eukprot:333799-Prymnesium_polylepis.1
MHAGTDRACGSPKCARDGLRNPRTASDTAVCTPTAGLSRENSQRGGNSDRSTAHASGPEPHDSGHTVND